MENNLNEILGSDIIGINPELKGMFEKVEKKRSDLKKAETELRERTRKARTRHLIEVGALVAKASISQLDKNLLLGAFMFISNELKNNPDKAKEWTEAGLNIFQHDSGK